MENKKLIGKKVWLLDGDIYRGFTLGSKQTYTVKGCKAVHGRIGAWEALTLERDSDGKTIEVHAYQVVVALDGDNIYQYLADNGLYAEVSEHLNGDIEVEITWGDWKHEHLWCRDLMGYIGYERIGERVTEENGDDAYSAIHTYRKIA